MFIVRSADVLHSVRSAMFSISSLSQLIELRRRVHCTPKGVRALCWCRGYKDGTPSGVARFLSL